MISLYKIESLSEDEVAFLLYALNHIKPPKPITDVSYDLIRYYQPERLRDVLEKHVRPHINESGVVLLDSVINKLLA